MFTPANELALKEMHAVLDAYAGNKASVNQQTTESSDEDANESNQRKKKLQPCRHLSILFESFGNEI